MEYNDPQRLTYLPNVLSYDGQAGSMLRALKQILEMLELVEPANHSEEDRLNASIDDTKWMIKAVGRESK